MYQNVSKYKSSYIEKRFELTQFLDDEEYHLLCKDSISVNMIYINDYSFIISTLEKDLRCFVFNDDSRFQKIQSKLDRIHEIYYPKPKSKKDKFASEIISNAFISNNILFGKILFAGKKINIEIDPELNSINHELFEKLTLDLDSFREYLSNKKVYKYIIKQVAVELTNTAFEQSKYQPNEKDYIFLEKDMKIKKISYFVEGYSLEFQAKNVYPEKNINVQFSKTYEI